MKITLVLLSVLALSGCAAVSPENRARSLMDRLEFEDDEEGCFRLNGQIDLNPIPFMTSTVTLDLRKTKGADAPDC